MVTPNKTISVDSDKPVQHSFRLILFIAIIVSCLSFFKTDFSIGNFKAKKIDFFSDLKIKPVKRIKKIAPLPAPPAKDSLAKKTGVLMFELYEGDTSTEWKHFFAKLQRVEKGDKTVVRIAWFGDSLIEGDLITQDVRNELQKKFGGKGVGFVPITTHVPGFRKTIGWTFSDNWKTYSLTDSVKHKVPYGAYGQVYVPRNMRGVTDSVAIEKDASKVKYSGAYSSELKGLSPLYNVSLLYSKADSGDYILYRLNNGEEQKLELIASDKINRLIVNQNNPINSIEIRFVPKDTLYVYGFTFESSKGIVVDNYSLRGSSGIHLSGVKNRVFSQIQQALDYDLIVMQYGVNVASEKTADYSWYSRSFTKTVNYLETIFTNTPILIVGCSDRSIKQDGNYITMPTIPSFISSQREIASNTQSSFWDLFTAMGGEGSMIKMADAKPALANKDYTHFKASGGKVIANLFVQSLLFEYDWYLSQQENKKPL